MNHTHYLEVLLLLALSCPAAFSGLATARQYQKDGQESWNWSLLFTVELLLLCLALLLFPLNWQWSSSAQKSWLLVPLALLLTLGGEILFLFGSQSLLKLQKKRFWAGDKKQHWFLSLFFLLATALFEELLYRSFLTQILQHSFSLTPLIALLVGNCFFAMIHCYQGAKTLVIKFFSGLVYAFLFWLSKDLMLSIVAHMLHNAVILIFQRMKKLSN